MDRAVVQVRSRGVTGVEEDKDPSPAEKLLKYFPEAALALYVTLDPLFRQVASGEALTWWLWFTLALSALFCWLYLSKFWAIASKRQKTFSVGALVLYVAAIGGPFATYTWYKTIYGTIAAVIATAFLVLVPADKLPKPPDPPPA